MGQAESQGCCSKSEQPSVERIEAQSPAALSLDEIRLSSDCESGQRAEHGNTDTSNSDAAATIPPAPEKMQQTMTAREVPLLEALSATETPMKQYLLDGCVDGKRAVRLLSGLPVIACLILSVAAVSSMPFVIPLADPNAGVWTNIGFVFGVHGALNYLAGYGVLKMISRACPEAKDKLEGKSPVLALIYPFVCGSIHVVFGIADIFPMPFSVATACGAATFPTMFVTLYWIPEHRRSVFATAAHVGLSLGLIGTQAVALVFQWRSFPHVEASTQIFLTVLAAGVTFGLSKFVVIFGVRFLALPKKYLEENKIHYAFLSFLFSALLLSQAKSAASVLVILGMDLAKAVVAMVMTLEETAAARRDPNSLLRSWEVRKRVEEYQEVLRKLRRLTQEAGEMSSDKLEKLVVSSEDATAYTQFSISFVSLAVVELCEVMVPLIYLCLTFMLASGVLGENSQYFALFAGDEDAAFRNGTIGNLLAIAVEASVLVMLELATRFWAGLSILNFASIAFKMDFAFWFLTLNVAYMAFNLIQIEHGGFRSLINWVDGWWAAT